MIKSSTYGDLVSPFSPEEIQQSTGYTCAVKSQQLILNMFGVDVTEQQLIDEATRAGILTENGTSFEDVGKLMEMHGVETQAFENGNIATLMNELAQGHQVIVGVDSGELWSPLEEYYEDSITGEKPDHAVIITGIDVRDPNNVQVIVTDPGNGTCSSYPYEQFVNSWSDSGFFMVSTTTAPDTEELEGLDDSLIQNLKSVASEIIALMCPMLNYIILTEEPDTMQSTLAATFSDELDIDLPPGCPGEGMKELQDIHHNHLTSDDIFHEGDSI